jgi:hypothetical protein
MTIDFTKIRFAGEDMIMITIREKAREPILLLDSRDILKLNDEWNSQENTGEKPVTGQAGLRQTLSKDSLDNTSKINDLINKDYVYTPKNLDFTGLSTKGSQSGGSMTEKGDLEKK